jgi:ferredoxin
VKLRILKRLRRFREVAPQVLNDPNGEVGYILRFLPETVETVTVGGAAWIKTDDAGRTTDDKILAVGDVERPGLATNALGAGKRTAEYITATLRGEEWKPFAKKLIVFENLTTEHYDPAPKGDSQEEQAERCLSCGSCRDCHLCETICPTNAISRKEIVGDKDRVNYEYFSDPEKCIACGFCADTCPCGIWTMRPF